jgi:hypothetical protein
MPVSNPFGSGYFGDRVLLSSRMTWTIIFLFYIIAEMIGTLPPYPDFFR